jgi:hypothetical protein
MAFHHAIKINSSCAMGCTNRPPKNEMLTHESAENSAAKTKN